MGPSLAKRSLPGAFSLAAICLVVVASGCGDSDEPPSSKKQDAATPPAAGVADRPSKDFNGQDTSDALTAQGPQLGGDQAAARAGARTVDDVYEELSNAVRNGVARADVELTDTLAAADGDSALVGVCELMSPEARDQTVVYARRSSGLANAQWTCERATGLLLRRARQRGGSVQSLNAEILGVVVNGDRATASVTFRGRRGISTLPLVKENGQWKLAASPGGAH